MELTRQLAAALGIVAGGLAYLVFLQFLSARLRDRAPQGVERTAATTAFSRRVRAARGA